jgi:hypothetical protein
MKLSILIPLLAIANGIYAQQNSPGQSKTLSYCTNVGPVEITIHGDSATGRYLLTVTPELKKGIIKGTFSKGLFEGIWDDPDGVGRIIIGFNPDLTRFLAMYNTSKDASHWYNEWRGVSRNIYPQLSPEEKKDLECNWR